MKISFTTKDNVKIVGEYMEPEGAKRAILLLHMMPATKESWINFAEKLNAAGWATLAIDERGHGESQDGPSGYQEFDEAQQQAKIHDVEAAVEFVREKGLSVTAIAGASIGANLALVYQADRPEIISTIALSPGLNYRGVETLPAAQRIKKNRRVYFVASHEPGRQSGNVLEMTQQLYDACAASEKQLFISEFDKHGTDIFQTDPGLEQKLIAWLE